MPSFADPNAADTTLTLHILLFDELWDSLQLHEQLFDNVQSNVSHMLRIVYFPQILSVANYVSTLLHTIYSYQIVLVISLTV